MKLWVPSWLVDRIVARAKRTPYFHLPGYMERYWLFQTRWLSCRLHVILRSDDDRALHDHPWDYATVILRGGYVEVTRDPDAWPLTSWVRSHWDSALQRRDWIAPGRVLFRRAESLHRLEIPNGQACLTLFFMRPPRRTWGFMTPTGWVQWQDYENLIDAGEIRHAWRGAASEAARG